MLKKILLYLALSSVAFGQTLSLGVAGNMAFAVKELSRAFEKEHPQSKIIVNIGSSGKLTAQILHGAPYDVFLSADMQYPSTLYKASFGLNKPIVYAEGRLALLSRKGFDTSKGLAILTDETIHKIAIANPQTAPYGRAAKEVLEAVGLYKSVKKKLVYGESVASTLSYTLKATDIGIVSASALQTPQLSHFRENSDWIYIDDTLYSSINQGAILLKHSQKSALSLAFMKFLTSPVAKEILQKNGYK